MKGRREKPRKTWLDNIMAGTWLSGEYLLLGSTQDRWWLRHPCVHSNDRVCQGLMIMIIMMIFTKMMMTRLVKCSPNYYSRHNIIMLFNNMINVGLYSY